ncbi:ribosomal protein L22/L17 [Kockovaella imperatae]|uniref:Ribosomal protein L22/L17 n=1 Tax=Kockovaella imperatae TaxID=4999 RepID=A0A1Y1UKT9_9TREE|nr:ribosomal protein L22/L17 [Kockovaella imperatae]ORX38671.1 ribosomal protein L22/L17 [Kockovaella imperatae]
MSRTLRGAAIVAQSAVAGPSRLTFRSTPLPNQIQRRHASFGSWFSALVGLKEKPTSSRRDKSGKDPLETNPFDVVVKEQKTVLQTKPTRRLEYRSYTNKDPSIHQISPLKLNNLANQIAGLPVDEAIIQMQHSSKKAARWIKKELEAGKDIAIHERGLKRSLLQVSEAWVQKAKFGPKKIDIKGRGRYGIKIRPFSRLRFTLTEGMTPRQKEEIKFQKDIDRYARGAAIVREDTPLRRKITGNWAW